MARLLNNHLAQFAALALALSLLGAVAISAYVSDRLTHDIELLQQHGEAMRAGTMSPEDPFSIPSIQDDVREVRWTTFALTAGVLATIYLSVVGLVWRGWRAVQQSTLAQREAEARLEATNTELKLEVAERGRAEEAARRSEAAAQAWAERLRQSNEELEQFAYVASHDLQQPLRMVSSYTQLLAKRYTGQLDEDADEFIGYAVDGANRMQNLINDLLEFSRVSSREQPSEVVPLAEAVRDASHDLAAAIEESGATISCDDLADVYADRSQVVRLLQNLIGNAIKFRGEEPPQIHISAERRGHQVAVCVRDNGIGVDTTDPERIFGVFKRLHTVDEYEGNGIGLAICKRIVEQRGGRLWVESEPGDGSEFWFTLPAEGDQAEYAA